MVSCLHYGGCITQRSLKVRGAGAPCQATDYARHIPEILAELGQIPQPPRRLTSPEALEAWEHEIRHRPAHLGRLVSGCPWPQALESAADGLSLCGTGPAGATD